jgi:hypothetical protein
MRRAAEDGTVLADALLRCQGHAHAGANATLVGLSSVERCRRLWSGSATNTFIMSRTQRANRHGTHS